MRRAVLAAAIALAASVPARGQSLRVGGTCVLPSATDTLDAVMTASVVAFDPRQRVPSEYVATILDEVVRHLAMPPDLRMAAFARARGDSTMVYPAESMMAELVLARNGAVARMAPVSQALAVGFDSLVFAAVRRADESSAFPPVPEKVRGDSVAFRLMVSVGQRVEKEEKLVARMRVPAWRTSALPAPAGPSPTLQYPKDLQRGNVEGEVVVQYVIGSDSTPVFSTVRVLRYTDIRFWEEVRRVLAQVRVSPGMVGDCPIPMLVRQPFNFLLR